MPLGVLAAWRFGGWLDRALMGFSVLGFSVPVFVLGYLLIWLVSLKLGWLPVQGYQRLADGFGPFLRHLILPAITLSVDLHRADRARHARRRCSRRWARTTSAPRAPRACPRSRVLMRHALANAAVPIVTVIGIGIALLIGGVVVTESVYAIPGLGRLTVDAVLARDFPTIQGVILLFSFAYVLVNLLVDLLVRVLRPADPLLMARHRAPATEALVGSTSAAIARSRAPGSGCARNWSVRIGGIALLALLAADRAARALARHGRPDAVRPAPAATCCPARRGEITTLDGETLEHTLPDGHRQLRPRHLQPRALRRARVADRRHLAAALVALAFGIADRPGRRATCAGSTAR